MNLTGLNGRGFFGWKEFFDRFAVKLKKSLDLAFGSKALGTWLTSSEFYGLFSESG